MVCGPMVCHWCYRQTAKPQVGELYDDWPAVVGLPETHGTVWHAQYPAASLHPGWDSQVHPPLSSVTGRVAYTTPLPVTDRVAYTTPLSVTGKVAYTTPLPVTGRVAYRTPLPVTGRVAYTTPLPVTGRVAYTTPLQVTGRVAYTTPLPVTGRVAYTTPLPVTGRVAYTTPLPVTGRVAYTTPLPVTGRVAYTTPHPVTGRVAYTTPLSVTGRVAYTTPLPVTGRVAYTTPIPVTGRVAYTTPLSVTGRVAYTIPLPVTGRVAYTTPLPVTGRLMKQIFHSWVVGLLCIFYASSVLTAVDIPIVVTFVLFCWYSCGGNILINVGPTSSGRIVPAFEERLRQLGTWLKVNGEAIYSSKPWTHQNDTVAPNVWSVTILHVAAVYKNLDVVKLNLCGISNTFVVTFLGAHHDL